MSRDGDFFEGPNILISTFCVCTDGFQDLSKALNYLLVKKMPTETLLRIPFSVIGRCSLVPISHELGKYARINLSHAASSIVTESQAASCKHFSVKIAALGSLKRVNGIIFKFKVASLNFNLDFFIN